MGELVSWTAAAIGLYLKNHGELHRAGENLLLRIFRHTTSVAITGMSGGNGGEGDRFHPRIVSRGRANARACAFFLSALRNPQDPLAPGPRRTIIPSALPLRSQIQARMSGQVFCKRA